MLSAIVVSHNDAAAVQPCLEGLAALGVGELCWIDDASGDATFAEAQRRAGGIFGRAIFHRNHRPRGLPYSLTVGSRIATGGVLRLQPAASPVTPLPEGPGEWWLSLPVIDGMAPVLPGSVARAAPVLLTRALFDGLGGVPDAPSGPAWALAVQALWFCDPLTVPGAADTTGPDAADILATRRALLTRMLRSSPRNPALPGLQTDPAGFWTWAGRYGLADLTRTLLFPYAARSRLLDAPQPMGGA